MSLEVPEGKIVTLVGANGAGKSTTLRAVSGQIPYIGGTVEKGRVIFQDREITFLPVHKIARLGVIQVPEGRHIFPNLSVLENLYMGGFHRSHDREFHKDLDHVFGLFPRLQERKKQLGGTLSGGERQMLAIGRAIMAKPLLIMMDEPSLGLSPKLVDEVFDIIQAINSEGTTILLVEQNAMAALSIAHQGSVLESGRMVLEGAGTELLEDDRVRQAYLGEDV
ncbi:MAG TPA: ABC transporter ATP-binding protein [Desulfobulbaceae bacterium]|nr:ABC transporter ATP-binding protein [Desulfobulbaceae bacterium]